MLVSVALEWRTIDYPRRHLYFLGIHTRLKACVYHEKKIKRLLILKASMLCRFVTFQWKNTLSKGCCLYRQEHVICSCYNYNNQINARALIGQSDVGYCAGKPTEKSRVF